jgi:hypothetical protein
LAAGAGALDFGIPSSDPLFSRHCKQENFRFDCLHPVSKGQPVDDTPAPHHDGSNARGAYSPPFPHSEIDGTG